MDPDGTEETPASRVPARAHGAAERVAHIESMMREGEWIRGRSGPVLARLWGCDEKTVRHYAAEASRRVRYAIDAEGERLRALQTIDRAEAVLEDALADAEQADEAGTRALLRVKAAAELRQAAGARITVVGAGAPKRVEVTTRKAEAPPPGWIVDGEGESED